MLDAVEAGPGFTLAFMVGIGLGPRRGACDGREGFPFVLWDVLSTVVVHHEACVGELPSLICQEPYKVSEERMIPSGPHYVLCTKFPPSVLDDSWEFGQGGL